MGLWPKRRQTRRLNHFPSSWACVGLRPLWAFVDKLYIKKKYNKKNLPMPAQTTCLASFGPFSLFVGLRGPSLAAVGPHGLSFCLCVPA